MPRAAAACCRLLGPVLARRDRGALGPVGLLGPAPSVLPEVFHRLRPAPTGPPVPDLSGLSTSRSHDSALMPAAHVLATTATAVVPAARNDADVGDGARSVVVHPVEAMDLD